MPNYAEIIDLIRAELPEFEQKTDEEVVNFEKGSHNVQTDTVKYLIEGDRIIGFYRYTLHPRENPLPHTAHTLDTAVLPTHQRKGFGARLMKDLIQDCRDKGITRLLSRTFKSNTASVHLHQSLGFAQHFTTEDSIVWELHT